MVNLKLADLEANAKIDATWVDRTKWTKMTIISTACMGKFSSDRSIKEYADEIWQIQVLKKA